MALLESSLCNIQVLDSSILDYPAKDLSRENAITINHNKHLPSVGSRSAGLLGTFEAC